MAFLLYLFGLIIRTLPFTTFSFRKPKAPPVSEVVEPLSLAALPDLAQVLSGHDTLYGLLRAAGEWLQTVCRVPLVVIYGFDHAFHDLASPIVLGPAIPGLPEHVQLGSGVIGEVGRQRTARFIADLRAEPRFGPTAKGIRAVYCLPVTNDRNLFGVLTVQFESADALQQQEQMFYFQAAKMIGAQAAMSLRLANSGQAIQRFDRFQQLAQSLTDRLDSRELLQTIVSAGREMLDTQMSMLLDLDNDTGDLRPIAWSGITDETARLLRSRLKADLKGLVAWARRPARTADLRRDQRTALATQAVVAGMLSELAVPVMHLDRLYGVLAVETNTHRYFTDEETNLLTSLAAQAGIALRNAQLFENLQQTNRQLEKTVADLVISQQQAENARLSALEANQLKTEFINNMSHELRTPLNAVINFTRIVMDGHAGPVTPEQVTYLDHVHESGQHLLGLINDILDLAKIEAGKMELRREPTDLEPILRGVMSTAVGLTRDKGLWLKQEIEPSLPKINIDSTRIRQVLLNLLSNAAKFTTRGGITLRAKKSDGYVIVGVQDTGIGIKPEDLSKVFEEFRQIDGSLQRTETGTGLGMPISQRFVQLHGGEMWIESVFGQGTQVYFSLPVESEIPMQ